LRTADRNFSNSEKPERTAMDESIESVSKEARLTLCNKARLTTTPKI